MSKMPEKRYYKCKNDYICKIEKLTNYKLDQTVIVKKEYIHHIPGIKLGEDVSSDQLQNQDWYPFVNSYYPFTEDVDPYARVNHLFECNAADSCGSTETFYSSHREIPYSEEGAQNQYLQTKPMSFFILGKPGLEQEAVGKRLAEYWGCVYIDPLILLEEEINGESRAGQCIEFNLRCGRAVGIDVIIRLLARKLQSASVLHRGFVLCGFPLVPNDLYEDDPISSESAIFNVQEIFEEIFEQSIHIIDDSAKVEVSMIGSSRALSEVTEKSGEEILNPSNNIEIKMSLQFSYQNEVCGPKEIATDLDKQMNCLFGFFHDPFIIIYVHCRNTDVVSKRSHYYFDIYSKRTVDMQKVELFYEVGGANDMLTDDLFGDGNNPFSDNPQLRHLVVVPENLAANVSVQLDRYHQFIANPLDCRILTHSHQYYIKLDGRSYISQMIHLVKLRLEVLPIQKVILPQKFQVEFEQGAENVEPIEEEQLPLAETLKKLSKQQIVGFPFKWSISNWGTFCPVSMYHGEYVTGDSKFAVHFMNNIFFLANENAFLKFYNNPRRYLLPPFPKPGSKAFVFGPPKSGKTAVAKCLGFLLNSRVLTPLEMHESYLNQLISEYREKVRQAAIVEGLKILKEQKLKEFDEMTEDRKQKIDEWENSCLDLLTELNHKLIEKQERLSTIEVSESGDAQEDDDTIWQKLQDLHLPQITDPLVCQDLILNRDLLREHLPQNLQDEIQLEQVTVLNPFVLQYANDQVENAPLDDVKQEAESNFYEMYNRGIKLVEEHNEFDGWVIDGMSTDVDLLNQLCEDFTVNEVIFLNCTDNTFLVERIKDNKRANEFRDFRNFFLSIQEKDAAYRSPSIISTESYKKDLAGDILSDILNFDYGEGEIEGDYNLLPEQYEPELLTYSEDISKVQDLFATLDAQIVNVSIENLTIEQLLKEVVNKIRDQYRRTASEFTEEDRAEEVQMFLAQQVQHGGEGGEAIDKGIDDSFAKNRRYGDSYYYCPVSFANNFVLWRGKEEFAALFRDKVYLMATEEDMKNFIKYPMQYLINVGPRDRFPPPRICVVGYRNCGKTAIAKALSKNLGASYTDFHKLYTNAINTFSNTTLNIDSNDYSNMTEGFIFEWLNKLLGELWFDQTCKYLGFVFDDFPRKPTFLNYMLKIKAIPDMIICVSVKREDGFRKQLDRALEDWKLKLETKRKANRAIFAVEFEQWEEQRKKRYDEIMEMHRENRYTKKITADEEQMDSIAEEGDNLGFTSDTQISFDSVIEQQEHEETLKILDEELPEPIFQEYEEDEEKTIERLTTEIETDYTTKMEYLEEMREICNKELIPWFEIDGNQDVNKAITQAYLATDKIKFRNKSLFERCYDVPLELAEKLLDQGYFFLSCFGRNCPVQHYENYNPLQVYFANEQRNRIHPVIHRRYIYFINGKDNYKKFVQNPLKYIDLSTYHLEMVPVRMAVIGPPKCGKSALANRFRRDLGFRVISRGAAIRYTIDNLPFCCLNNLVESVLRKGEELSDETVMDCVNAASFCGECVTQGLIFDGFPNSPQEMVFLSRLGLVPHLIFDLQISDCDIYKFAASTPDRYPLFSQRFTRHLLKQWKAKNDEFRNWCDLEYQNIYKLAVDRSIWGVWDQAKEVSLAVSSERKHYHRHAKHDWPLRLANMIVTPLEFLQRQSNYKTYCPVCLYYQRALTNGGEPPDRTGLVHFRKYFYWICEKHIEEFLKVPEKFIPPSNISLPQDLPIKLKLTEEPEDPAEDGYCLVCYQKNIPNKVLVRGTYVYAVFFKCKIFLFDTIECLNMFLCYPTQMSDITIYFKRIVEYPSTNYEDLPVLGMLEQYVSKTVTKAVTHCNVFRPIVPGLSVSTSALICIGLNLKVFNPKTPKPVLPLYQKALELFHQRRLDLLKHLDLMKKYLNPLVHYEEPSPPSSSSSTSGCSTEDDPN